MTERTWHKGAPPHIGWWCSRATEYASNYTPADSGWRWWNGSYWSGVVFPGDTNTHVAEQARRHTLFSRIEWSHYYPPNASVARINPDTGKVTGAGPMPCKPVVVRVTREHFPIEV